MELGTFKKLPLGGVDRRALVGALADHGTRVATELLARQRDAIRPTGTRIAPDAAVLLLGGSNGITRALALQLVFGEGAAVFGVHFDSPALAKAYDRGWREPSGDGARNVIGFKLPTREDVDRTHDKLTALGYQSAQPPYDTFWGARYAIVEDPDGNHVGLMSPPDPSRRRAPPDL